MKFLILMMSLASFTNQNLPPDDILAVSELVHDFSKSADQRDGKRMQSILHKDFRAIVNQAMGSKEVQLIDKASYLDLMKKEVIGGDTREVTILSIDMEDKNAVVKARFAGKELVFTTFIQAVKTDGGSWKLMSDMPVIQKK